jgi:predicted GNAT family acetyltransferase
MNLVHEEDNSRYVLLDGDEFLGEVLYEKNGDLMLLLSAVVPDHHQGKGFGKILVRQTLEHLRDHESVRVQPVCPFIAKFMMQNPEFQALRG